MTMTPTTEDENRVMREALISSAARSRFRVRFYAQTRPTSMDTDAMNRLMREAMKDAETAESLLRRLKL